MASLLPVALLGVSVAGAQTRLAVEWDGTRLGLTAEGVPLSEVLRELARQTGMEFRGLDALQEEVSVHFSNLPLREALERLLARTNYMVWQKASPEGGARPVLALVFRRDGVPDRRIVSLATVGQEPLAGRSAAEDERERLEALHDAAGVGDEDALQRGLSDPSLTVQAAALALLAEHQGEKATPRLLEGTRSSEPTMRLRALDILNGSPGVDEQTVLDALDRALGDEDAQVKKYAMRALADRGGPEAAARLHRALRDTDPAVRMAAIDNIVRSIPPAGRIPLLREAASDGDEEVRSAAATWLEQSVAESR